MNHTIFFYIIFSFNLSDDLNENLLKEKLFNPMHKLISKQNSNTKTIGYFFCLILNDKKENYSSLIYLVNKFIQLDRNFHKTSNLKLNFFNFKEFEKHKNYSLIIDFLKLHSKIMEIQENDAKFEKENIEEADYEVIKNLYENKKLDLCFITNTNKINPALIYTNLIQNLTEMLQSDCIFENAIIFLFDLSESKYSTFELIFLEETIIRINREIKVYIWTKNDDYFINTNQKYNQHIKFFQSKSLDIINK